MHEKLDSPKAQNDTTATYEKIQAKLAEIGYRQPHDYRPRNNDSDISLRCLWLSHEDKNPSAWIKISGGKVSSGCSACGRLQAVTDEKGEPVLFPTLITLSHGDDRLMEKMEELDIEELEDGRGVRFPMTLGDGEEVGHVRTRLDGKGKWQFEKGAKASEAVFGLYKERVQGLMRQNFCIITESPLDASVLYAADYPAIAVMGKSNARALGHERHKRALLEGVDGGNIYVWQEPDAPRFAQDVANAIGQEVYCITPTDGQPKDAHRLWLAVGRDWEKFRSVVDQMKKRAESAGSIRPAPIEELGAALGLLVEDEKKQISTDSNFDQKLQFLKKNWKKLTIHEQKAELESLQSFYSLADEKTRALMRTAIKEHLRLRKDLMNAFFPDNSDASSYSSSHPKSTFIAMHPDFDIVDLVKLNNKTIAFCLVERKDDGESTSGSAEQIDVVLTDHIPITEEEIGQPPPADSLSYDPIPAELLFPFDQSEILGKKHTFSKDDWISLADSIANELAYATFIEEHWRYLLTVWILGTYLADKHFDFYPGILLFGPPERGKTRLLHWFSHLCYRPMLTDTVNEAPLFRFTERFRGTVLFDLYDFHNKIEKKDTQDLFLAFPERGRKVARVVKPDAPDFEDTKYFQVFAPCAVASNKPLPPSHPLVSRYLSITPPERRSVYPDLKTRKEELAQLRARLFKWRAFHLSMTSIPIEKPCEGRLGDLLGPLFATAKLIGPKYVEKMKEVLKILLEKRQEAEAESLEGRVVRAIYECTRSTTEKRIPFADLRRKMEELFDEEEVPSNRRLGLVLNALGIPKGRDKRQRFITLDDSVLEGLYTRYLNFESTPTDQSECSSLEAGQVIARSFDKKIEKNDSAPIGHIGHIGHQEGKVIEITEKSWVTDRVTDKFNRSPIGHPPKQVTDRFNRSPIGHPICHLPKQLNLLTNSSRVTEVTDVTDLCREKFSQFSSSDSGFDTPPPGGKETPLPLGIQGGEREMEEIEVEIELV